MWSKHDFCTNVSLKEAIYVRITDSKLRVFNFSQIMIHSHSCPEEIISNTLCFLLLLQWRIISSPNVRVIPCAYFAKYSSKNASTRFIIIKDFPRQ